MGVGYNDLRALNPGIVYVSVSGFGSDGPYADQMVYDFVIQALCGIADFQQGADGQPELVKNIVVDKVTALTVSQAVTAALFARSTNGGQGQHVEISMLDTGLCFMGTEYATTGVLCDVKHPPSNVGGSAYRTRPTADGHVVLNLATMSTWPRMQAAFAEFDWAAPGGRWDSFEARQAGMQDFAADVEASLAGLTTEEVVQRMRAHDLPVRRRRSTRLTLDAPRLSSTAMRAGLGRAGDGGLAQGPAGGALLLLPGLGLRHTPRDGAATAPCAAVQRVSGGRGRADARARAAHEGGAGRARVR